MSDTTLHPANQLDDTSHAIAREDQALIDLATAAVGPQEVEPGHTYVVAVPAGAAARIVDRDLDEYRQRPRRKTGRFTVTESDSFVAYLTKHKLPETEVWADVQNQRVVGVVNGHELAGADAPDSDQGAGWGDHRVELQLHKTPAWLAWERLDRKLVSQLQFAEHVEDRLIDVVEPSAADLLEIVQTFTAKRRVSFESSQRLSTGVVQVAYREDEEAKAGKRGQLSFPEQITLGLIPFEGGVGYKVKARLRYRIDDGSLRIGFVLDRPEDVLRTAFLEDVGRIRAGIEPTPVFVGVSA